MFRYELNERVDSSPEMTPLIDFIEITDDYYHAMCNGHNIAANDTNRPIYRMINLYVKKMKRALDVLKNMDVKGYASLESHFDALCCISDKVRNWPFQQKKDERYRTCEHFARIVSCVRKDLDDVLKDLHRQGIDTSYRYTDDDWAQSGTYQHVEDNMFDNPYANNDISEKFAKKICESVIKGVRKNIGKILK